MLAEGMAEKIISMYALETSTRAIGDWMEENLGIRVSAETINSITDRVLPEIKAWRSRSLNPVYAIVWLDAKPLQSHGREKFCCYPCYL